MSMHSGGQDVTKREAALLRKEIAAIEKTLAKLRNGDMSFHSAGSDHRTAFCD